MRASYIPLLLSIGGFEDGFALLLAGASLPLILAQLHPSAIVTGLLISLPFLGSVAGAAIFGRLGDRIGRRKSYLYVIALLVAGSVLGAAAWSARVLLASRFIVGFGIGGDIPTAGSLLAEIADSRARGRYVSLQSLMWGVGGASASLLALPFLALGPLAWRYVLALGAIPPLLVLILNGKVPESPLWATRVRVSGLARRLRALAGRLSLVSALYFTTTFALAVFANYTVTIMMRMEGLPTSESLLVSALQWAAFLCGSALVNSRSDRLGRRPLVVAGTAGMAASLFILRLAPYALLVIVALMAFWVFGGLVYATTGIYAAELFPTDVRSTCNGVCFASGRLGGFLSTLAVPVFGLATASAWMAPSLVPAFIVLSAAALMFAPRTERRALEEIVRGECG